MRVLRRQGVKNKYKEKVVKLVDENRDFETQQNLNHNSNMIDKQTNNKEERGIDMRKETTNKPKKEPFLITNQNKISEQIKKKNNEYFKEKFQRSEEHTNKKF